MAKKKVKKISGPGTPKPGKGKPPRKGKNAMNLLATIARPRVLSTFAFGVSGLLAGLATGLNHFPPLGYSDTIPRTMLLSAYLGDPHVDMLSGLSTGFAGLVMGACLGFSALSEPRDLFLSMLFSVGLAIAAVTFTGSPALAGIAFLIGHAPSILTYWKLRNS